MTREQQIAAVIASYQQHDRKLIADGTPAAAIREAHIRMGRQAQMTEGE